MIKAAYYTLFLILFISGCNQNDDSKLIDTAEFHNPSAEFRSIPFYSLNDKLDGEEIARQLSAFKEGGFGGSYLHSRIGLLTEYMGNEWWEAMDAGVRASDSLEIQAWFYDEDKWPSGFAGGIIPRMNEEFRGRSLLRVLLEDETPPTGKILHKDKKYKYVDFREEMGEPWFNGTCWVDLMNPEMVKAFIDVSYKPYAERYKDKYGKVTFGIFTDEPQISPFGTGKYDKHGVISFSPTLLKRFRKEHDYDITPHLASLFDTVGDFRKIRIDYYRTLANQFEESFSKQIGDYCKANNMIWTGHFNGEESTSTNAANAGNMAIQYRHMQQPGIDHLALRISGDIYGSKQMTSVANQYGKKRRLCEAFGISGQNMSFEDRKWIVDWLGIMGVNHICPHLSLYSMKGERKRDYPPTLSPQQPWWKYNKTMEDYIGRICYINSLGKQQADILVLSPLESAFIEMDVKKKGAHGRRGAMVNGFLKLLMEQHVDFDIGDEQILKDIAEVKDKKLVVGEMKYKAVVLPYLLTIRSSTISLIEKMNKMGLNIYYVGKIPTYIDGSFDEDKIKKVLKGAVKLNPKNVLADMKSDLDQSLTISGKNAHLIWKNRRVVGNKIVYQLSNTSRLESMICTLVAQGNSITLWNPVTGEHSSLNEHSKLIFAPTQTWIISMDDSSSVEITSEPDKETKQRSQEIVLPNVWKGKRLDKNTLTLDFAAYSKGQNKNFSNPEPVIGIHSRLTENQYNGLLKLKFDFNVKDIPQNCSLVLEQPEMYQTIMINGKKIEFTGNKIYRDHSFKMQTIDGNMKEGTNSITLILDYVAPILDSYNPYERYGTEIESIYLTGDFGVTFEHSVINEDFVTERNSRRYLKPQDIYRVNDFWITKEKKEFNGNLVKEGYPFYNGDFELSQQFNIKKKEGKKYFLEFEEIETTVLSVSVNEKAFNPVAWNPWKVDITEAIITGDNKITLKLTNSLRNLLGPHHHIGGELIAVGPGSFMGISYWTSRLKGENDWYDRRISGNTAIWVDDYFLIPIGIQNVKVVIE